jgi:hypothetical protein
VRTLEVKPAPAARIEGASSICPGQSLTLSAIGTGTYRWSENSASTSSITVSPSVGNNTYSVSITNDVGCTTSASHTVALNLSGTASNDGPLTCSKSSAILSGQSGAQGATYTWKNTSGVVIATTASTSVNQPGVYSLEIRGIGGCTYSTSTEVLADRSLPILMLSNNGPLTCAQTSVALSGSSNVAGTYEWRDASGTLIGNNLNTSVAQAGTYTLKVTGNNGCSHTASTVVVADLAAPVFSASNDGPLTCSKSSVTLSASSSTAGLHYVWKNGSGGTIATSATATVSVTGSYTVEARGSNACKSTLSSTVTQSGNFPNISANNTGPISCVSAQATLQGSSNTPGVRYEWYNATNRLVASTANHTTNISGTYTLKVITAEGCASTANTTIGTMGPLPQSVSASNNGPLTCSKNSVVLGGSTLSNNVTYEWRNASGVVIATTANKTVTNPGAYTFTVRKNDGCALSRETLVREDRPLPQANIAGDSLICASVGTTTLSASGGGTYYWSTGETTASISPLDIASPTQYTVTVSTGLYCNTVVSRMVRIAPIPNAQINNGETSTSVCEGSALSLSASGGMSYKWSSNAGGATTATVVVKPTTATTYTVTVTSDEGCGKAISHSVSIKALPSFELHGKPSAPFCGSAQVNLNVTAGNNTNYTWQWSTGETGTSIQKQVDSTRYLKVTARRNNGCTRSDSAWVQIIPKPVGQIEAERVIACYGDSTTLRAPVGTSYLWSNQATTASLQVNRPSSSQSYAVTVSNGNNCSTTFETLVNVPAKLELNHDLGGIDDCVANNAEIIPQLSGGTGSISVKQARQGTQDFQEVLNGLGSGTYTLVARDQNSCVTTQEVVIVETPVSISQLSLQNQQDCTPGNTRVLLSTTGDRLPLKYRLNDTLVAGPSVALPRGEGEYTLEVEDAAGCKAQKIEYFLDYDAVVLSANNPVTDCSTPNGSIELSLIGQQQISSSADGGNTWQPGNRLSNLRPGTYPTAVRNETTGCVSPGPSVQVTAPACLPEAGFTKDTLMVRSTTQRIVLPWRVDRRAWGDADQPFSLLLQMEGNGQPHFVSPTIATAQGPQEKSGSHKVGQVITYSASFAGTDELELVLQPEAANYLEPGIYTFTLSGEGIKIDPNRDKIIVFVDFEGRLIVTPIADCPGIDITLTAPGGECWDWPELGQSNQRTVTVKHIKGRIYTVNYLENLVKKTQVFVGDNLIDIPIKLDGIKEICPGDSYNIWWRYKDKQFGGDNATSIYASEWKVEWVPHPTSIPDETFPNVRRVSPTETTTYKVLVTYIPTGCKFELTHTVEVDDLFEKAEIKAKENSRILCYGNDVILDIENPQNVNLGYTWTSDNGFTSSSKPPLKVNVPGKYTLELRWLGKSCFKTIEFDVKSNDPCEIKKYFESNGFYAIPINIKIPVRPQEIGAELRAPCEDSGEKIKDDAGLGFDIQGDPLNESIHLKGIFETSLTHFSTCFGYNTSQALISENTDLCSCDNYLAKAEKRMRQSGLQYWSHVFEGKDCDGQDYLFVKAKMPDGTEYGSNGADFLNAGLNYGLNLAQGKGGRLAMSLVLDHMLDNFVEVKSAKVFSQAPPQKLPESREGLGTMFQPSCIDGKNFISANVFSATGQLIQLPPETVWRFDIDPQVKLTQGVLVGYTQFQDDALVGIYTGRKKASTEEFLGYYLRGSSIDICKPQTFKVPDTDANGFLNVDVGNLIKQRFIDYANCGQAFEISLVNMRPNILAMLPGPRTITPQGLLFTGPLSDLAFKERGVPLYSSKPVYSYSICPEAIGDVASNVGTDYSRLGVNLFYNAAESSIMYQIKDAKGNPLWLYIRAAPGSYVNGCGEKYTYYIWNCKLATWQEVNPNNPTFASDCATIQKLFKAFENSQVLHKVLESVGYIPIIGDIASLANGIIYLAEGDIGRGKTELFWAVVGIAGDLIPIGGVALRLVNTVGSTLSPGVAKILAIVKLVPCPEAPSLVENELGTSCLVAARIMGAERVRTLLSKLQGVGFKFSNEATQLMTKFIHNNRLGNRFHDWLKDVNVEHLAVILKTGLDDLKWPASKLEDIVEDLMNFPGLLEKMANNPDLIKAWDVMASNSAFRQNEVYLERLANLVKTDGFDWAKLKSSFETAVSKGNEQKWIELKIPKSDLEKTYQNGLNDIPSEYTPYSPEHKAQRWEQYKAEKAEKGEVPQSYESWSNTYDGNIDKAKKANEGLLDYYNSNGWTKPPVHREYPISNVGPVTTSNGKVVTGGRRFDIYDELNLKAIEYKEYSGTVYKSEDIEIEALKDAFLLQNNQLRSIEWVFKGCKPSQPLRDLLRNLNITVIELP